MKSETINCTSIFLDVRNFTGLMKEFSGNPEFLELIKNVYKTGQTIVSSFCTKQEYYINSTGDGFLCIIFGETHYIKAYLIGILLVTHLPNFFSSFFVKQKDHELEEGQYYFGIGMESGHVEQVRTSLIKQKYIETYLGNVINISSRIESLCKEHCRAPMLYGPEINNLLSENVFNVPYTDLVKEAKDSHSQECANVEYKTMDAINHKLLSTYIYEHKLKGVDKPIPIFRISPTQLKNLNIYDWEFLTKIPNKISTMFVKLYKQLKVVKG